jgi:hypothetical protein
MKRKSKIDKKFEDIKSKYNGLVEEIQELELDI